ncbi:MAG: hypothetical protein KBA28_12840 [Syntrophaceae bacterium]|jgi:hypothetical protein|nr:hypothetical protein [Syntrophaceae bacterium]
MKRYRVKFAFAADTGSGESEFHPGDIITLSNRAAAILLADGAIKFESEESEPIWKNPYPTGTAESWRASMEFVMDTMLDDAVCLIQRQGQYSYDPQMKAFEDRITEIYKAVLNKERPFADFQSIVSEWTGS